MNAFFAAALNGSALAFEDKAKADDTISLKGFKAAMLYADEQQGRLGTVTAAVAKGDRPASAVPGAKPEPVLRLLDIPKVGEAPEPVGKAVSAFHRRTVSKQDCSNLEDKGSESFTVGSASLGKGRWLVESDCWRAAYQAGTVMYLHAGGKVEAAPFEKLDTKSGRLAIKRGRQPHERRLRDSGGNLRFRQGPRRRRLRRR